jgi:hypothetical protein
MGAELLTVSVLINLAWHTQRAFLHLRQARRRLFAVEGAGNDHLVFGVTCRYQEFRSKINTLKRLGFLLRKLAA